MPPGAGRLNLRKACDGAVPAPPGGFPARQESCLSTNEGRAVASLGARKGSINRHGLIDFTSARPSIERAGIAIAVSRTTNGSSASHKGMLQPAATSFPTLVKQMKLTLAVLLMTAALAVPAAAQSSTSTSGVVVSSTTESLVVRMDDGTQRTFNVTSTTNLPSARLAEGNRVTVQYRPLEAGLFEAARVELATALDRDRVAPTPSDRSMMSETTATQRETDAQRQTDATQRETAAGRDNTTTTQQENARIQGETTEDRETLPATASPMPLLALAGLGALVAGLVMKARRTA